MLEQFINLLTKAEAAEVADSPLLTDWHQADTNGDPDNQVVRFAWTMHGQNFEIILTEAGISQCSFDRGTGEFTLADHEGDELTIRLYRLTQLMPE